MTTRLAVVLDGAHVADVERTRPGVLRLTYHDDLPPGATPLSLALPPQRGRFTGEAVETWLWGLLPESEEARSALRRTHGADPRDPLSLLAAISEAHDTSRDMDDTDARQGPWPEGGQQTIV